MSASIDDGAGFPASGLMFMVVMGQVWTRQSELLRVSHSRVFRNPQTSRREHLAGGAALWRGTAQGALPCLRNTGSARRPGLGPFKEIDARNRVRFWLEQLSHGKRVTRAAPRRTRQAVPRNQAAAPTLRCGCAFHKLAACPVPLPPWKPKTSSAFFSNAVSALSF